MTTASTMTRGAAQPAEDAATEGTRLAAVTGAVSDAASAASDAATTAAGVAGDAAARLPALADRGRVAFEDATRRVQAGTDETLTLGTAVSFGFAAGLLVGGANRILVMAALVPVTMMGLTLLDRTAAGRGAAGGARPKPANRQAESSSL